MNHFFTISLRASARRSTAPKTTIRASAQTWLRASRVCGTREKSRVVFLRMEAFQTNLYSHVQSTNGLAPKATVAPRTVLFVCVLADSHRVGFTLRDINSGISCCRQVARSSSKTSIDGSGTRQSMAPEMLEERPQTVAVNVWTADCSTTQALGQRRIRGQPLRRDEDVLYGASPRYLAADTLVSWVLVSVYMSHIGYPDHHIEKTYKTILSTMRKEKCMKIIGGDFQR